MMRRWFGSALGRSAILVCLALCLPALALARGEPGRALEQAPAGADPWITVHLDELIALYTHLHTHPELSRDEVETSKRIADELTKAGAAVTTNVGKLGVVGVLKNGDGPVVLVRTEHGRASARCPRRPGLPTRAKSRPVTNPGVTWA